MCYFLSDGLIVNMFFLITFEVISEQRSVNGGWAMAMANIIFLNTLMNIVWIYFIFLRFLKKQLYR